MTFDAFIRSFIGPEPETLQECEDCHDEHDLQQTRLSFNGNFRCDKCTERDDDAKDNWLNYGQYDL